MPVVTRSQSKTNTHSHTIGIVKGGYKYASELEYPRELAVKIEKFNKRINDLVDVNVQLNKTYKSQRIHDINYYNNIRVITYLFKYIHKSIDKVFIIDGIVVCPDTQTLINTLYLKTLTLPKQLTATKEMNLKEEEYTNRFLTQLKETGEKLYPYVSEN